MKLAEKRGLLKAIPESFEPDMHGPFFLAYLLGDEMAYFRALALSCFIRYVINHAFKHFSQFWANVSIYHNVEGDSDETYL